MSADRRRYQRLHVELWVEEQHGRETYYQRSANLSAGGIYLDGTIPHPRGAQLSLKLTLPGDAEPVSLRGEVVGEPDAEHLGMHVKFVGVAPPLLERLRALVEG